MNADKKYLIINSFFRFCCTLSSSLYVLNMEKNGLNEFETNLTNTVFMFSIFLFEVPTGVIADKFSRKISTVLGILLWAIALFVFGIAGNFWIFIFGEFLAAIGFTLMSGAFESWLYETLKNQEKFDKTISKEYSYSNFLAVFGAYLGGVLAEIYDISFVYFLSAFLLFLVFIFAVFSMQNDHTENSEVKKNLKYFQMVKNGFSIIKNNKNLTWISILLFFINFGYMSLNMYWPLILDRNFEVSKSNIGLFFAIVSLSLSLGAYLSKFLQSKNKSLKTLSLVYFMISFSVFVSIYFIELESFKYSVYFFSIFFFLHEIFRGFEKPIISSIINKNISDGTLRSTINSSISMIKMIGSAFGLVISGMIATQFGLQTSWTISAFVILFVSVLGFSIKYKTIE